MRSAAAILRSSVTLIAIAGIALALIVALTFRLSLRAQSDLTAAVVARDIVTAAVELRYGLQSAEASQRGYLVNGNEIYLAPLGTARTLAGKQLQALTALMQSDPEAGPMLQRLDVLVREKLDELDQTIALKRARRDGELAELLRSNRGKALMDEANVFLSSIIRHGNAQLTEDVARQKTGLEWLGAITLAAALLILVMVAVTLWLIGGFVRDLRRAQEALNTLNASLERRVRDRTAELTAARDRAEVLLAEVNHRVANSLALVASMVGLQARAVDSAEARAALSETQGRINAVALVHKKLYTSGDVQTVELAEFLPSLLQQLETSMSDAGHRASLKPDIAAVSLPTDKSVSVGIIAAEWVTNAYKYAYPDGSGEIRVTLARETAGDTVLQVEDDGVGRSTQPVPQGTGLGTKLVQALASSLGGRVEYGRNRTGTSARLILPAA